MKLPVMGKTVGVPLAALAVAIAGCGEPSGEAGIEQIARVPSPDGVVDAVLTEWNHHATVAHVYRVHVVPAGWAVDEDAAPVLLADQVEGLSLAWTAPRHLELAYEQARIFDFTNFWHSRDVRNFRYIVEIRLTPKGTQLPPDR